MSNAATFLRHLESLFGEESEIRRLTSTHAGMLDVSVFVYPDTPESGLLTCVTFGLSAAQHPEWRLGTPELILTIDSADRAWADAVGWVAERFRGEHPFTYGSLLSSDAAWASDTSMSGLVVFAPAVLDREAATITLPNAERPIHLVGVYPLYAGELPLIQEIGLERFWHLDGFEPLDPRRKNLSRTKWGTS
jgi:hypothetical protein